MLYSSREKRAKSGWLKENYSKGFSSPLKLQKFLFFYEMLSKTDGDEADFSSLKGYENGPVFSDVYGDYFYRKSEFINGAEESYVENKEIINEKRAELARFLVNILNEEELSDLTHEFNIWNAKEDLIKRGIKHVSLDESDFTNEDEDLLKVLKEAYTPEFINSVDVLEYNGKSFIINKNDIEKISEDQLDVFIKLSYDDNIENPVYINIADDGVILVD